jgi:hypothetical protein
MDNKDGICFIGIFTLLCLAALAEVTARRGDETQTQDFWAQRTSHFDLFDAFG